MLLQAGVVYVAWLQAPLIWLLLLIGAATPSPTSALSVHTIITITIINVLPMQVYHKACAQHSGLNDPVRLGGSQHHSAVLVWYYRALVKLNCEKSGFSKTKAPHDLMPPQVLHHGTGVSSPRFLACRMQSRRCSSIRSCSRSDPAGSVLGSRHRRQRRQEPGRAANRGHYLIRSCLPPATRHAAGRSQAAGHCSTPAWPGRWSQMQWVHCGSSPNGRRGHWGSCQHGRSSRWLRRRAHGWASSHRCLG